MAYIQELAKFLLEIGFLRGKEIDYQKLHTLSYIQTCLS